MILFLVEGITTNFFCSNEYTYKGLPLMMVRRLTSPTLTQSLIVHYYHCGGGMSRNGEVMAGNEYHTSVTVT